MWVKFRVPGFACLRTALQALHIKDWVRGLVGFQCIITVRSAAIALRRMLLAYLRSPVLLKVGSRLCIVRGLS